MGIYKVLKDFPSRNGVKQYKVDEVVHLNDNSRTKALEDMGYIKRETSVSPVKPTIQEQVIKSLRDADFSEDFKVRETECWNNEHWLEIWLKEK